MNALISTGKQISGALTLALQEVNTQKLNKLGHSLDFEISETYGEENTSIWQTADLWKKNVFGYIGPQETCVHEGRMSAAFNLPMISYVRTVFRVALELLKFPISVLCPLRNVE